MMTVIFIEMLAPLIHLKKILCIHVHDLQQIILYYNNTDYCEGIVAYVLGKVHFGTMLKEGLYNRKMTFLGGKVEGRGAILGKERQNTQTMIYSSPQCERWMGWVKPLWLYIIIILTCSFLSPYIHVLVYVQYFCAITASNCMSIIWKVMTEQKTKYSLHRNVYKIII